MPTNIFKTVSSRIMDTLGSFKDVRLIGAIMFLVVALMITWSGVHVIETNYRLQQDIALLQQQNQIQELKNQNLALENTYLESDEYLELEARKNLGLAAPGETVWVVPKAVALRNTVAPLEQPKVEIESTKPTSNFEAWLDFLLNRQSS